jgi:hypothetical protein
MIAGEFTPVNIGFGFTLNGVGGLLGLHRGFKTGPLRKKVRTGSLGDVLFPEDVVANAQRIISDLRSIFPPEQDKHVFGPMAKLGWGSPTLITLDLGVLVAIPDLRITVLGRISTELPDEEAPLIVLNMDVLGIIDIPAKKVSIDATLYDSRVVAWTVSGGMALLSTWGENPRFVLTVGGFNPRFEPPKDFPDVDRIRVALGDPSGNPAIVFKGYFAVTSNTFQVGAHVKVQVVAGPVTVKGQLGFDALFQFDPFKFVIDFLASLEVTVYGKGLTIRIEGTIKGPGPFEIHGKLEIEVAMFTVSAEIDVTLGSGDDREPLPAAEVLPKLTATLAEPKNWSAQLPDEGTTIVTLREIESGDDEVLAHPLGSLTVRQTTVPLERPIETFGNHQPGTHDRFRIRDDVTVEGPDDLSLSAPATETFAPAKYTEMSDAEKLDSGGFESMKAGRKVPEGRVHVGGDPGTEAGRANRTSATVRYETTVIDKNYPEENEGTWGTPLADMGWFADEDDEDALLELPGETGRKLADTTAGGESGSGVDADGAIPGLSGDLSLAEENYTVVRADDGTEFEALSAEGGMTQSDARMALRRYEAENPEAVGDLTVTTVDRATRIRADGSQGPEGGRHR